MIEVDRIKERAKAKDVSLRKIYRELELPQEYLRDVNAGKTSLSEARLQKIADYLNTTIEYLRGETDEPSMLVLTSSNVQHNNGFELLINFYNSFSESQKKKLIFEAAKIYNEGENE